MSKPTNTEIQELLEELEEVKVKIRAVQKACNHHYPESDTKQTYNMLEETCSKCGYIQVTEF